MFKKLLAPVLCLAAPLVLAGCAAFDVSPTSPSAAAPASSVQHIVADEGYTLNSAGLPDKAQAMLNKPGKELFRWEKELRENHAAGSLVFDSLYGGGSGVDYHHFFHSVLWK